MILSKQVMTQSLTVLLFSSIALQSITVFSLSIFQWCFLFALIFMLFFSFDISKRKIKVDLLIFYIPVFLFVTYCIALAATVDDLSASIFFFSVTAILIFPLFKTSVLINYAFFGLALGGMILISYSFGQYLELVPELEFMKVSSMNIEDQMVYGYTGLISSRGTYGISLLSAFSATFLGLLRSRGFFSRAGLVVFLMFVAGASVISLSRSTMAAVLCSFLVWVTLSFLSDHIKKNRSLWFYLLVVFIGPVAILILSSMSYVQNIVEQVVYMRVGSVEQRVDTMAAAIDLAQGKFLFGIGSNRITESLSHVIHNAYVACLVERGIVACLIFVSMNCYLLGFLFAAVVSGVEVIRVYSLALLPAFVGVQIELMFFRGYLSVSYWAFVSVILMVMILSKNERRDSRRNLPDFKRDAAR